MQRENREFNASGDIEGFNPQPTDRNPSFGKIPRGPPHHP
jgi:hypothetical protein